SLGIALYTTFAERKVAAILQDRPGPNRVGPFGLFQPFADGLKLIMKEDIIPTHSNKVLFVMGPIIAMSAALMTSAIIPWSSSIELFGRQINLQVTDINIGILYAFAVVSMGVYGIMIGGWASNNKFSLLAALRGASQAISYELAMGLSLVALILLTGSLSLKTIVQQQIDNNHFWNIVYQPLGFFIFFVCALAECNRAPFDMPEAESELNFGYHQEYSSMKLGFYLFAEYVNMIMSSAIMVCLYFGGYDIPFLNEQILPQNIAAILGIVAFLIKIIIFIFVFMWIRWTIPRFRYDQLMKLGWRTFIPLSLFNLLLTAFLTLYFNK
ncbi:MAG: NADH-quinone oxidoreductase subunit NuoH, partial [Sediminibacterium sp.]|nr:NADH-quinone oxidoreductase subunit NuoH [Sediminibacterium sp.]